MIMIFRRSSIAALCLIVLLVCAAHSVGRQVQSFPANSLAVCGRTVVIDAGHGNPDGGCSAADGTQEAALNLLVAQKLADILLQSDCRVVMTRTTSEGLYDSGFRSIGAKKRSDMYKRRDIQQNAGGDIFVSIHMNKFEQSKYYGAQVVYDAKNDSARLLARCIQASLRERLDPGNKREAMAAGPNIFLLKSAPVASVVVECGFMSNPQELGLLKTDDYQSRIAWAVYDGILKYFEQAANQSQ